MTFSGGFGGPAFNASVPASVASSNTVVTLQAANSNRVGWTLYNESTAILYLHLGPGASVTVYTVQVPANGYFELPFPYQGIITGVWSAVNGNARVVEFI